MSSAWHLAVKTPPHSTNGEPAAKPPSVPFILWRAIEPPGPRLSPFCEQGSVRMHVISGSNFQHLPTPMQMCQHEMVCMKSFWLGLVPLNIYLELPRLFILQTNDHGKIGSWEPLLARPAQDQLQSTQSTAKASATNPQHLWQAIRGTMMTCRMRQTATERS